MYELTYLALDDNDFERAGYEVGAIEVESELIQYDLDEDEDFGEPGGIEPVSTAEPSVPEAHPAIIPSDDPPMKTAGAKPPAKKAARKKPAAKKKSAKNIRARMSAAKGASVKKSAAGKPAAKKAAKPAKNTVRAKSSVKKTVKKKAVKKAARKAKR